MFMENFFGDELFNQFLDEVTRPVKSAVKGFGFANMPQHFPQVQPSMRTDITECENGYDFEIELPGFAKEDISAELKDGYMTIVAKKESVTEDTSEENADAKAAETKYIRRERIYGTCKRSFYVGEDIKEEDIKAKFENGVLKLFVPKIEPEVVEEEKSFIHIDG